MMQRHDSNHADEPQGSDQPPGQPFISEKRLRTVIEALPIGVWFTDVTGRIVLGNAAGQRIWSGARYVGPAEYAQYKARWVESGKELTSEEWGLTRALKGETSLNEIIEIETFDGETKIIRNAALPFRDDDGRIIGALAINEDITEQWRASEQLERLAATVRSSTDAIVAKTRDGIITDWNPGAERMYGFSRSEAVGSPITIIIPDDRAGEAAWLLELVGRGQVLEHYETERVRKDGSRLTISLSLSPIHNALGQVVGAATISRDMTTQREAEQRLKEQARALAQSDRHKDEFIATLAHELRNPLAPIVTVMDLIRVKDSEQRFKEPLAMLRRQVDYLTRLLDDLMDASRISRGTLNIHKEPIEVSQLVDRAVEVARSRIEERDHALSVTPGPASVIVLGDMQRLVQVVVNLLNNAAKYTEPGGRIWLEVDADREDVRISVRDTGIGIAPDMLEPIFHLFRHPQHESATPQRGLGLGLTLVRSLVEAHGGTVTAHSPGVGQGSEFVVTLPRLQERRAVDRR